MELSLEDKSLDHEGTAPVNLQKAFSFGNEKGAIYIRQRGCVLVFKIHLAPAGQQLCPGPGNPIIQDNKEPKKS